MLTFAPITQYKAGIIASLLVQSYTEILTTEPQHWLEEKENWLQFDREVFENPDTIGRCVFVTSWEGRAIGLGSYDPRQQPDFGIVGHNCILPQFRRNGYGKQQILELLNRCRKLGIHRTIVSTSEHPFFLPAQKMYLSCGFKESKRYSGGSDPRYRLIEYSRNL